MLGYSRERIAYRIFNTECKQIIEERNVVFDETQKGSYHLKDCQLNKNYRRWDIENFFDISESTQVETNGQHNDDDTDNESIVNENDNNISEEDQNRDTCTRGRPRDLT